MEKLTPKDQYTRLANLLTEYGIYTIIIGLFFSNALKSIGTVTVAASILFHKDTLKNWKLLVKNNLYLSLSLLALIYILSILIPGDLSSYWELSKNKWLYFFFPVAIINLTSYTTILRNMIVVGIMCGLAQSIFGLYHLMLYSDIDLQKIYSTGNIINTYKIHHVQISILYSILILLVFIQFLKEKNNTLKKISTGILFLWFFIAVHIYAVRSGIILTYIFIIGYSFIRFKRISLINKMVFIFLLIFGVTLMLSLNTVQHRIGYLKYDIEQYLQEKSNAIEYTDSRRLISINVGLQLIKEHKWLGTGLGNIKNAAADLYKKKYPDLDKSYYYLPHSQYIFFGVGFGILLGLLVCIIFIYPCYYFLQHKMVIYFLISFGLIIFALWDAWLGTLFGNTIYLLLISLGIKKSYSERTTHHQ